MHLVVCFAPPVRIRRTSQRTTPGVFIAQHAPTGCLKSGPYARSLWMSLALQMLTHCFDRRADLFHRVLQFLLAGIERFRPPFHFPGLVNVDLRLVLRRLLAKIISHAVYLAVENSV